MPMSAAQVYHLYISIKSMVHSKFFASRSAGQTIAFMAAPHTINNISVPYKDRDV